MKTEKKCLFCRDTHGGENPPPSSTTDTDKWSAHYCDRQCYKEHKKYNQRACVIKEDQSLLEQRGDSSSSTIDTKSQFQSLIESTGGYPVLCAHRGGGSVFSAENTLEGFAKSVEYGARLLELDIRTTRDGVPVLMHWGTVDETTDGSGSVSNYSLAEIRRLDAAYHHPTLRGTGIRVPTLREFLDRFVPVEGLLFFFDYKDVLSYRVSMNLIRQYSIEHRYCIGSVIRSVNHLIQQNHHETQMIATDIVRSVNIIGAYEVGLVDYYHIDRDIVGFVLCRATTAFWGKGLVDAVHRQGKRFVVSGYGEELNRPERLRECIDFGVDFIMVDRPDLVQEILLENKRGGGRLSV